jgi:hypothetical protein
MVGKANDEINSFDAMLSFLTWREAFNNIPTESSLPEEERGKKLRESSAGVLREMKFLYPEKFSSNGETNFLQDAFNSLLGKVGVEDAISNEIEKKAKKLSESKSALSSHSDYNSLNNIFFNDNFKHKIRVCPDNDDYLQKFRKFDKDLFKYLEQKKSISIDFFCKEESLKDDLKKMIITDFESVIILSLCDTKDLDILKFFKPNSYDINSNHNKCFEGARSHYAAEDKKEEIMFKKIEYFLENISEANDEEGQQNKIKSEEFNQNKIKLGEFKQKINELLKLNENFMGFRREIPKEERSQNTILAFWETGVSALRAGILSISSICSSHGSENPSQTVVKASLDRLGVGQAGRS